VKAVARSLALGALLLALSGCFPAYRVALFGDVPYSESAEADYDRLIGDVNEDAVAFSSHVGDFKSGSSTCTDEQVQENIGRFDTFTNPLVYTPGDNEWTDCSNSLVRLDQLRALVFRSTGTESRGATTMTLTSQAALGYPENATWTHGPVTFATLHIVGSGDDSSNPSERAARRQADIDWLHQVFLDAESRGDQGVVLIAHAGLRFGSGEGQKGAYESMFLAVRDETLDFTGEVLYVHGDGHTFKNDQPMKTTAGQTVANFRRVEVYGDPDVRWVRLTVTPNGDPLFSIDSPPVP
jgi:hypothetical protein